MTIPYSAKREVAGLVRQALAGQRYIEKVERDKQHPHEIVVTYRKPNSTRKVRLRVKVSFIAA